MSDGTVLDGTVSESPSRQSSEIWQLRERIAEALKKDGYTYKYDISLPLDTFYDRYKFKINKDILDFYMVIS